LHIARAEVIFYVLLTVHLDAILGNDQLECVIPDDVLMQFGPPDDEHLLLETCRGMKWIHWEGVR
jgi:hypothetical protein